MLEQMDQKYKSRWKGKDPRTVSIAMRKLANIKHMKRSTAQKRKHAQRMVAARGHWEVNEEGKEIYVRHNKQSGE